MKNNRVSIPPYKDGLIIGSVGTMIAGVLVVHNVKPYLTRTTDPWFLFLLSLIILLSNCVDYILDGDGIICRYMAVPVRHIKWSQISDSLIMSEWNDLGRIRKEDVLLITLAPCRPYDARLYSIFSYRFNFLRKTIFIHLPKEKADLIVQTIQHHLDPTQFRDMRN